MFDMYCINGSMNIDGVFLSGNFSRNAEGHGERVG